MAKVWEAKAPAEVKRYSWDVPVVDGDSLSAFTCTASGATKDSQDIVGNTAVVYVSGGTAATTASFAFTATTTNGETFKETVYLPILATGAAVAHSETAQTIIEYALRPITGLSGTATSDELADALEILDNMLTYWRGIGADVGAITPLALASNIYAPDAWIMAIKNNLRVMVSEIYGRDVAPITALMAKNGLQAIRNDNLTGVDPVKAEYF